MYRITKEFAFSASHRLDGLPDDHQCARLHGHNYIVVVELAAILLDNTGFVVDFGDLSPVKDFIDKQWDHRHLNDFPPFRDEQINPTAESMARFLFDLFSPMWPELVSVRVSETPKTWAVYEV